MAKFPPTYPQNDSDDSALAAHPRPSTAKKTVMRKNVNGVPSKTHKTEDSSTLDSIPVASEKQGLWLQCLAYLQRFLPEQQIRNWLRPLHAEVHEDGQGLKIYVASRFKMDYTRSQYGAIISKALEHLTGRPMEVFFAVGKPKTPSTGLSSNNSTAKPEVIKQEKAGFTLEANTEHADACDVTNTTQATGQAPAGLEDKKTSRVSAKNKEKNHAGQHLHANLRFDNLVVGSSNHMAYTAALNVASSNSDVHYNPLFIYGASGLGKTHMLHAIGNHYLSHKPDAKVLYTHADKFVGDVVKAFRFNSFEEFRQLYYNLDIHLIDDVQEFSVGDKAKTLEEFFYLFQALLSKHSLIVLTSDTFPKELEKIPDRLISRFVSGLTVALDPPPMEMRVAILMKKAEEGKFKLPEDVAFFIAKNVQSNVRELEGALRNVHAYAQFQNKGQKISIHTAKEALRDLLSAHKRQITIENIQKTVADYYRLKIADMHSKRRPANIAKPRQIAMYLSKEMTQKSLPEIGSAFGGRDHTTVLHAVKKINKERSSDEQLRHDLHILEQSLKG